MPNRILRESILDSEAVDKLTVPAELFYRRLMSVVDDFGRFDARPSVLRSRCYPLRVTTVREADISRWLAECEAAGLIALYSVDGKQYILFQKLGEPRAKSSKFPPPPAALEDAARRCAHVRPYSGSDSSSDSGAVAPPPISENWEPEPKGINRLCRLFDGRFAGPKLRNGETLTHFRSLVAAGVPESVIEAAIKDDKRDPAEYPRELAKRVRAAYKPKSTDEYAADAKRRRDST